MDAKTSLASKTTISKLATVIIFLALIRSISEPFRLQYYATTILTYDELKPFLTGALIAATALLAMTILSWFGRHKTVTATCLLTIILLLIVKKIYFIP